MRRMSRPLAAVAVIIAVASLPHATWAQPQDTPSVKLVTLGTTAGPLPRKDRAQSANLLVVGEKSYLIDAGDGVARRLVQAGADFTDIGQIFITHDHNDHTAGLANLLDVAWQYARKQPIEIYGPPGTEETVKGAIAFDAVDEEIRTTEKRENSIASIVEAHNVGTGEIYNDGNIAVTAVENTHFHFPEGSPARDRFKSYSYRFDTKGESIVFTGDTGPSAAVEKLAEGADVLVSEALAIDEIRGRLQKAGRWAKMTPAERDGWQKHMQDEHITPEQAGELAAKAGVKTLILTHLSSSGRDNDDYQRFVDAAAGHFKGRILAAHDLMVFTPSDR